MLPALLLQMNLDSQLIAPQECVYLLLSPLTLKYIDFSSLNDDFSGDYL